MRGRRRWFGGLALLWALALAGPAGARELKFGYTPFLNEAEMRQEFQPLMDSLCANDSETPTPPIITVE